MDRVKSALGKLPTMADKLNDRVASSRFGRMFRLEGSDHVGFILHEAICNVWVLLTTCLSPRSLLVHRSWVRFVQV